MSPEDTSGSTEAQRRAKVERLREAETLRDYEGNERVSVGLAP